MNIRAGEFVGGTLVVSLTSREPGTAAIP
jgi:hypothetical protein